ncbi:MAG TPA: winged helix-turn-helix domain-containing protein [Dokdonella sp.]|uniref:winged helix-turn-helix domain-containing protein n=1 Tax=Dokdonella sp. TaxID=2291710 RepID=UPI002CD9B957|nr:winged helix-turn-helix domain-containing protein [Dokdonella sp.]HUD40785.1 winged helix-turn-helix domain-containing protein [Dokdonella sp.]
MQKVGVPARFVFADYELDAASRLLTHRGEPVAVAPRALECLIYLIQHADRAVGRDELISAVWARTDLNYTVLTQTLWKLRRALNESTDADSRFIRTVPRFGYQWIAPLSAVPAASAAPAAPVATPDPSSPPPAAAREDQPPPGRRGRRPFAWGLGSLLMLALLIVAAVWKRSDREPPPQSEAGAGATAAIVGHARRLLVLPVGIEGGEAQDAWVRLGIMDYLATGLSRDDRLQIVGSDRVLALLDKTGAFDPSDPAGIERLRRASGATDIVVPAMTHTEQGWRLVVTVHDGERMRRIESTAPNPLAAADQAALRLLQLHDPGADWTAASPRGSELIQRLDAASLAGDYAHGIELARTASAEDRSDPRFQLKLAQLHFRSGDLDDAGRVFSALAEPAADVPAEIRIGATIGLAHIAERQQRYADAERGYSAAIALLGDRGDPALLAQALSMRGLVNTYLGRADQGFADFARGRVAFARSGDEVGLAGLDANTGLAERARGRHQDAADAFDRALEVYDRFGMRDRAATALIGAVGERLALLQIARALALSDRADTLSREVQSPILKTYLLLVRGESLLADGRLRALASLLERLGPAADPASPAAIPDLLLLRVGLRLETSPALSAAEIESIRQRIEQPPEPAYGTSIAGAMLRLTDAALRIGDLDLARRLLERLQRVDATDRLRPLALPLVQGQVFALAGDPRAAASFRAALAEADRMAYPDAIVTVASAWAAQLGPADDRETLTTVAGRLQPYVEVDFRAARAAAALYAALGETRLADQARARASRLAHERNPHGER